MKKLVATATITCLISLAYAGFLCLQLRDISAPASKVEGRGYGMPSINIDGNGKPAPIFDGITHILVYVDYTNFYGDDRSLYGRNDFPAVFTRRTLERLLVSTYKERFSPDWCARKDRQIYHTTSPTKGCNNQPVIVIDNRKKLPQRQAELFDASALLITLRIEIPPHLRDAPNHHLADDYVRAAMQLQVGRLGWAQPSLFMSRVFTEQDDKLEQQIQKFFDSVIRP